LTTGEGANTQKWVLLVPFSLVFIIMANLGEIREDFIKRIRDFSLVLDDGSNEFNGSDNGADALINRGIRILARRQKTLHSDQQFFVNIEKGQIAITTEFLRVVRQVWVVLNSTGEETKLLRVNHKVMKEGFPKRLAVAAIGTITFTGQPANNETFVIGTDTFTFETVVSLTNGILIGGDLATSIDNAVVVVNTISALVTATDTDTTLILTDKAAGFEGNSIILTEAIANATADGSGVLGGTTSGTSADDSGRPNIYEFGLIELSPNQQGSTRQSFSAFKSFHDIEFVAAEKKQGIIVAPSPDQQYTLKIIGQFYPAKLSTDTDSNQWTELHEDLAVDAAMLVYYRDLNHTTNADKQERIIELGLKSIDDDIVENESTDIVNEMKGFVPEKRTDPDTITVTTTT